MSNLKKEIFDKYNVSFKEEREKIESYIVDFYGQNKKQEISKRLDRVILNNYFSLDDIKNFIRKNKKMKRRRLTLDFLVSVDKNVKFSLEEKERLMYDEEAYKDTLTEEQKKILNGCFDNSIYNTFSEESFAPIYSLFKDMEEKNDLTDYQINDIKKKTCRVLKALGLDINLENYDEVIKKESSKEIIAKAKELKNKAYELKKEFNEFEMLFLEEEQYIRECDNLKNKLYLKETKAFYEEIIPYVDNNTKIEIENALKKDIKEEWKFLNEVDNGRKYMGMSLLFSGKSIKEESDLSNEEKEQIEECRNKHKEIAESELFLETSSYKNNMELIESLGLIGEDEFNLEFMKRGVICCCPNYVKKDGNYEPVCLMHLPLYDDIHMLEKYKDTMFMHETLHAVELTSRKKDDLTLEYKTGFDYLEDKIKTNEIKNNEKIEETKNKKEKRSFELFSENIHQRNAMEITEKMHETGTYIFNDPYTCKTRGGTSYEYLNSPTSSFYNAYKDEINEARFNSSLEQLFVAVGKDNFCKLNDIVNEYSKIPYISMCRDLRDGKVTEHTKKRDLLLKQSEEIVNDMHKLKSKNNIEDICI